MCLSNHVAVQNSSLQCKILWMKGQFTLKNKAKTRMLGGWAPQMTSNFSKGAPHSWAPLKITPGTGSKIAFL